MPESECFHNITVETTVHVLPSRMQSVKDGVQNLLNTMLMRYNPQLEGIVMGFDKLKVLDSHAEIFYERPQLHFKIQARLLVFRPVVGSYVIGTVNKVEPDHIGLLVNGIFNSSVVAATGLSADYEYVAATESWMNTSTSQKIAVGTKLRVKISKVMNFMTVVSLECTMLDDQTGFV